MKVLQINTVCGQSSTGRITCELADMLTAQGNESKVLYGIGSVPEKWTQYGVYMGSPREVKLHSALSQVLDAEGLGSKRATQRALRWIRGYDPDIIHLHNIHGCYMHYPTLFRFLKAYGRPVVWTLHDCWPFTGHCAYFDYVGCGKWQSLCHRCPQSRTGYPRNKFFDCSARNFRRKKECFGNIPMTIVSPSQWLAGLVSKSFLGDRDIRVICNGIGHVEPILEQDNTQEVHMLAVANDWDARKGIAQLQHFAGKLTAAQRLTVIGQGSEQARVNERVKCIQRTENIQELYRHYAAADVFVNPTLEDNMPLVNLEALACGTPVVSFHTGGIAEVISPSVGAVVPRGDVDTLYQKAVEIAARKDALSAGCIARAKECSAEKCYQQYIQLYEELLG